MHGWGMFKLLEANGNLAILLDWDHLQDQLQFLQHFQDLIFNSETSNSNSIDHRRV